VVEGIRNGHRRDAFLESLDTQPNLGGVQRALDHPAAFANRLRRPCDRLAVTHTRLVHFNVQPKIAQQAVLNHFQMQFAHTADERLAGFWILLGPERWILLAQHGERFAQLFAVVRTLRLDRHRDNRFRKLDRRQQNRLPRVAQRVAGDRVAQADDAHDVARAGLL
jgi:hypothetical protein